MTTESEKNDRDSTAVGLGLVAFLCGAAAGVFKMKGNTASRRYELFKTAPTIEVQDVQRFYEENNNSDLFCKLSGFLAADKLIPCEHSAKVEILQTGQTLSTPTMAVCTQVSTKKKEFSCSMSTKTYEYPREWETVGYPTFSAVHHAKNLFLSNQSTLRTGYEQSGERQSKSIFDKKEFTVKLDPGDNWALDMVFPHLFQDDTYLVAKLYTPVGNEQQIKNSVRNTAIAETMIHMASKTLTGKDYTVEESSILGHFVKEAAVLPGIPIFVAGHIRKNPDSSFSCYEDGSYDTPFLISTTPLDAIERELKASASLLNSGAYGFGIAGALFLAGAGAVYTDLFK